MKMRSTPVIPDSNYCPNMPLQTSSGSTELLAASCFLGFIRQLHSLVLKVVPPSLKCCFFYSDSKIICLKGSSKAPPSTTCLKDFCCTQLLPPLTLPPRFDLRAPWAHLQSPIIFRLLTCSLPWAFCFTLSTLHHITAFNSSVNIVTNNCCTFTHTGPVWCIEEIVVTR